MARTVPVIWKLLVFFGSLVVLVLGVRMGRILGNLILLVAWVGLSACAYAIARSYLSRAVSAGIALGLSGLVGALLYVSLWEPQGTAKDERLSLAETRPASEAESSRGLVGIRFVGPGAPALVLVNESDIVVRGVKWAVAIWNVDLPDQTSPFPIPVAIFDFIRPNQTAGPISLFHAPLVASQLSHGNRLFGSAWVDCPDCAKSRHYVLYAIWGEGGWFYETTDHPEGQQFYGILRDPKSKVDFEKSLDETFPVDKRMAIRKQGEAPETR